MYIQQRSITRGYSVLETIFGTVDTGRGPVRTKSTNDTYYLHCAGIFKNIQIYNINIFCTRY